MTEKKENRGGKRPGSGRKAKAPTTITSMRLNTDALNKARDLYGGKLNGLINSFIQQLAHHETTSFYFDPSAINEL